MTLALRLGRTLHELTSTMTASELKMWIEYDRVSPISDRRGDIQAAQIATAVLNSQGGKASMDDLILRWGHQEESDVAGLENFLSELA
ncbi:DUF4035 domain-containing protein [Erwinia mallotivora]|uniref:DUF4035 domain-containing protein n=1 Tax=Erwinia mallotivora TaxID=69222 RepID=UPI0021C11D12|nr:DUF4035 domain-containing protein [Erwinia mallotivora]